MGRRPTPIVYDGVRSADAIAAFVRKYANSISMSAKKN